MHIAICYNCTVIATHAFFIGWTFQLQASGETSSTRSTHTRVPWQALLSSHGHNEQTIVSGHLYPLTTEANTGVCVLASTNPPHCHGPDNISSYSRQSQAMGPYARE